VSDEQAVRDELVALLRYANKSAIAEQLGVKPQSVINWSRGLYPSEERLRQVRRLFGLPDTPKTAPPAEADEAVPHWVARLLAGVISLENDAGITDDERDRARAQAMTWLELSGSRARRQGSGGGAKGGAGA
jgi:hypothetical protein